ncbi:UNVERIFIED_CONTAM: hypothetical protein Sradi_6941800 [Sesamum radiatum]|uniref:Uncharacterized protein n=1 Tax=Sesamum radiatum TaxID=300843 RepID=A0AAW2JFW5_SESRA
MTAYVPILRAESRGLFRRDVRSTSGVVPIGWASGPCAVSWFKCGQPRRRVAGLSRTATPRVGEKV